MSKSTHFGSNLQQKMFSTTTLFNTLLNPNIKIQNY